MLSLLIAIVLTGPQLLTVPLQPIMDGRPVIVHLASRDHVVSITTGPDGPRYTAKTRDGVLLATGLTLQELQEQHPDVYKRLAPAIAPAVTVDAGDDREPILLDASVGFDTK
jgi:hypothetical protein